MVLTPCAVFVNYSSVGSLCVSSKVKAAFFDQSQTTHCVEIDKNAAQHVDWVLHLLEYFI